MGVRDVEHFVGRGSFDYQDPIRCGFRLEWPLDLDRKAGGGL